MTDNNESGSVLTPGGSPAAAFLAPDPGRRSQRLASKLPVAEVELVQEAADMPGARTRTPGRRHQTGRMRQTMGSTAEQVVLYAPVSVTVVRSKRQRAG